MLKKNKDVFYIDDPLELSCSTSRIEVNANDIGVITKGLGGKII